jgi:hypothetical protein
MNVRQRSSHTHCQAPQANTLTKACQRVCLANPEMKEENQIKTSPSLTKKKDKVLLRNFEERTATKIQQCV